MKRLSLLLVGTLATLAVQADVVTGQQRTVRSGYGTDVSRMTQTVDDRSGLQAYRTRHVSVLNGAPAIARPMASKGVNSVAPKYAVAKSSQISPTLQVYGTVVYSDNWSSSYTPYGVYRLPVTDGDVTDLQFQCNSPLYSFFDGDHTLYSMYELAYGTWVMGYDLYMFDTETGSRTGIIEFDDIPLLATDVAYDPETGRVYGCFSGEYYGDVYRHWGYLDINARKVVKIANLDLSFRGVAIDKFGNAFGIDLSGNLYKVNKETGELTLVGPTGCPDLYYMSSAAYNDKDNNIILSFCNDSPTQGAGLVAIDPETALSTVVATFTDNAEAIGLYIPFQAPDKAPGTPELTVSCNDGSMTVNFTIQMPSTLFDGTDALGTDMGYKIYSGGNVILSGTAKGGETVEASKALTESGNTTFTVVATNEVGESNQTKAQCYVGKGTPAATSGVTLAFADGVLTLTWNAVTASSDGGYVNPADIRYDVVDANGNTVASDLTETVWTTTVATPDEITRFEYGVVVKYDAKSSKVVMSNALFLGHYTAPLTMDMSKSDVFDQHTVLDANNDGKTWIFNSSRGTIYDYDKSNNADDWIFSPAIYLEAGKAYDFEALARAYSNSYPERIEIMMGATPTAEGMTTMLVEPVVLGGNPTSLPASIIPAVSGDYFIGFHAISDAYQWNLYLLEYSISEPFGATAPDAVTDITLVPDVKGDLNVTVNFTAAVTTVTAAPYAGDMKVSILRDGEEIGELTVAAGANGSYTDNVPETGRYTYTLVSRNMAGEVGRSASASVFVGPNVPQAPAVVKVVENTQKLGEVTLTWEQPEADIDGNPLYGPNLTYNVYVVKDQQWVLLTETPVSERTFTFVAQAEDAPQAFLQVGVQTINKGIKAEELAGAGLVPVGPAYKLPVSITGAPDLQNYILGIDPWDGCEFGILADGQMNAVTSQDGDGQFFYGERVSSSQTLGTGKGIGDLIFGKVDLAGALHPVFSLYTWKITETDLTKLEIIVICEGESKIVDTIDYSNDNHGLWTKKVVRLEEYAGKAVQLIIRYYSDGLVYCFLDNMKFMDMPEYDLNAVEVIAPKTVTAGEPFQVTAIVENVGSNDAGTFAVELLANGNVVDTKQVEGLEAGTTVAVTFEQTINMAQDKAVEYTAHIVYDADADSSNDTTPKGVTVTREASDLPVVTNLTGTANGTTVTLSWDAITENDLPFDPTVESFENAEAFTKEYPGWTFVDRDGALTGSLGNIDIPNHTPGVDTESFIVIDGTYSGFVNSSYAKEYRAASGNQYIGAIWACNENISQVLPSDDWAISPLLKGIAQTVTFYAKNASINYSERLQIWYSTTDSVDPDDFEQLNDFNNYGYNYRVIRTDGWGQFSFDLPEGAVRFAFRVVSNDGMMLMIDDVAFLAADATIGLEHTGYNVYCDGLKLNAEPVTANTFVQNDVQAGSHTYHVTALYNRGESEVCEPLTLTVTATGADDILAENATVSVEGNTIVVTAPAETAVQIVSADGKTVSATFGSTRVAVVPGIYLVNIANNVTKVVVR